tara:strand:+ start:24780 stop:25400 length:621 start_codon:yes stop_codon:yes gene_type:complete
MSVSESVNNRVLRMKLGVPFSIHGFYKLGSLTSVQKAMSRLAKEGVVTRVSKGFYVRPKPLASIPSIKTTASAEQVAKVWAKENGYKLVRQGQEAAYRLGLQTQAPIKSIYWTNGPAREFKIGNERVQVKHISEKKLRWAGKPEGVLLRGLIVMSPESVELASIKTAIKRLSLTGQEAVSILRKLSELVVLQNWRHKLQEFERQLA